MTTRPITNANVRAGGVPIEVEKAAVRGVAAAMDVARTVQRNLLGHGGGSGQAETLLKADDSPVTVADFAVQAIVTHHLLEALGNALHLIGEECASQLRDESNPIRARIAAVAGAAIPDLDQRRVVELLDLSRGEPPVATGGPAGASDPNEGWWLLDPIDGTKGFLRGGHYCVALAFVRDGRPRFAVMGCPGLDDNPRRPIDSHPDCGVLFVAHHDGRCTLRTASAPEEIVRIVRRSPAPDASTIRLSESFAAGPSTRSRVDRVLERVLRSGTTGRQRAESLRLDSQCKYALVARDQADIYLRLPKRALPIENAWDHAAGALIAQEGGAWVSDLDGRPLDFSRGAKLDRNRGVLACDAAYASAILDAVRATGAATVPRDSSEGRSV